ncbi:hypothetical protein QYM36_010838 [Artemia franciscana]|uniref:BZIP domain-containing protein n=1 Tax=Artemia franciscana TaxID=6661 RepID=A0AA88HWM2_ARTSF|nr:hypothetical protein QYM36_010838 [Artemia franciscana]
MTAAVDKLKLIHPQSRKAAQMQKKVHREIRAIKQKKGTLKKQHIVGERVSYFKENLKADGNLYTPQEALELIERYLGRFDEEVEQIDLRNSIGQRRTQQHASRLDAIQMTHELEVNEFNGPGIDVDKISMNINSQYYTFSDMDSSYENFRLDPDGLLMGRTASFTNQEDILQDILGMEEVLNQSQYSKDHIDIQLQGQTNAGTSEVSSVVNEKCNIDQCPNTEGALPAALLPGCGSCSSSETFHDSNAAAMLSCSSPQTHLGIQLQICKSTQKAEIESRVNDKSKIDFAANTKGASVLASAPTHEISFGLETCQDLKAVGISPCSSRMDSNIDERSSANVNPAYQKTNNKCKKDQIKAAKNTANCLKTQKERNREAARAYRKRKRNEEQELEIKFDLLKKKKVVLEEELKSLKELFTQRNMVIRK